MIASTEVARIVLEKLDKLQREKHWGELVFKVSLKNGDPQQLAMGYEKTFRELWPDVFLSIVNKTSASNKSPALFRCRAFVGCCT